MSDSQGRVTDLCSVIIPTYNEEDNIRPLFDGITAAFQKIPQYSYEIIVVDDNSADQTEKIAESYNNVHVNLVKRSKKMGIGSAYREGFRKAKGSLILIMDADLSHDPAAISTMVASHDGSDNCIVCGSRYIKGAEVIGWSKFRKIVSKTANFLGRVFLRIPLSDLTGSYRVYSSTLFESISKKSQTNGFAFQTEAAFIASRRDTHFIEVPYTFVDRTRGKSKLDIKEVVTFALLILRLFFVMIISKM